MLKCKIEVQTIRSQWRGEMSWWEISYGGKCRGGGEFSRGEMSWLEMSRGKWRDPLCSPSPQCNLKNFPTPQEFIPFIIFPYAMCRIYASSEQILIKFRKISWERSRLIFKTFPPARGPHTPMENPQSADQAFLLNEIKKAIRVYIFWIRLSINNSMENFTNKNLFSHGEQILNRRQWSLRWI